MRDQDFEWDDEKAAANLTRHHVTFEEARAAYEDPNWIEFDEPDPYEERYRRICMHGGNLYVVIYTERDVRIRIISARRANKYEQTLYFERQA